MQRGQSERSQLIAHIQEFFEIQISAIRDTILCRSDNIFFSLIQLLGIPALPLVLIALATSATIADVVETTSFPADARCVPTFYVPKHRYSKAMHILLLMALGTTFGVIHCAGWKLFFPTNVERILWRYASLLVTIIPIGILPFLLILAFIVGFVSVIFCLIVYLIVCCLGLTNLISRLTNLIHRLTNLIDAFKFMYFNSFGAIAVMAWLSMYCMYLYALARLVLLGLALALLRHQPPGAFIAVNWTKFYPHF